MYSDELALCGVGGSMRLRLSIDSDVARSEVVGCTPGANVLLLTEVWTQASAMVKFRLVKRTANSLIGLVITTM